MSALPQPTTTFSKPAYDSLVCDDASSTAYMPSSAESDGLLPDKVRSKRNYLFSAIPAQHQWRLHVDDLALYSITESRAAATMTKHLFTALEASFGGGEVGRARARGATVTDACACVGGNTLSFAATFGGVVAVEFSPQRARMLANNARVSGARVALGGGFGVGAPGGVMDLGGVMPTPPLPQASQVVVHCGDYSSPLLHASLAQDAVFFDPPWGGVDYKKEAALDLFLGTTDVADLATFLTAGGGAGDGSSSGVSSAPKARVVAIKAPLNYNVAGLKRKLEAAGGGAVLTTCPPFHNMQLLMVTASKAALERRAKRGREEGGGSEVVEGGGGSGKGGGERGLGGSSSGSGSGSGSGSAVQSGGGLKPTSNPPASTSQPLIYTPGPPGSCVAWTPAGKEAVAVTQGQIALAFELLMPSSNELPVGVPVDETLEAVKEVEGLLAAGGSGSKAAQLLQSHLPPLSILSALPSSQHSSPPSSTATLRYRRPLEGTGWFLRADTTGALVLSTNPEVFLISQHPGGEEERGGEGERRGVGVTLRTCYSGIVRAGSDKVRLACRSTKAPAPSAPDPSEVFKIGLCPWGEGGSGGMTLTSAAYNTLISTKGGGGGGGGSVGGGTPPSLLQSLPPIPLTSTSGILDALYAGQSQTTHPPALFRPMFRDPILPSLLMGVNQGAAEGSGVILPPPTLAIALGIPVRDDIIRAAGAAAAAATTSEGGSASSSLGQRGKVTPTHLSAPFLSPSTAFSAVVKVQPWDTRVPNEVRALQVVSAFLSTIPSATTTTTPLVLPTALLRDASKVYQVLPNLGESASSLLSKQGPACLLHDTPLITTLAALSGAVVLQGLGMLHCDIHPGNLLLLHPSSPSTTTTRAYLCDFGSTLSMVAAGGGGFTYHGPTRGGRWDSMPMEQFGGGKWGIEGSVTLTPASDVFSIGTTLASFLLQRPPFSPVGGGKLRLEECQKHPLRDGEKLAGELAAFNPPYLAGWVVKGVHKDPTQRFPTASAALKALVTATLAHTA